MTFNRDAKCVVVTTSAVLFVVMIFIVIKCVYIVNFITTISFTVVTVFEAAVIFTVIFPTVSIYIVVISFLIRVVMIFISSPWFAIPTGPKIVVYLDIVIISKILPQLTSLPKST